MLPTDVQFGHQLAQGVENQPDARIDDALWLDDSEIDKNATEGYQRLTAQLK